MLVVIGCIIAGIGDLAFDAWAYAFAFSSVITQALYLLLVEFQANGGLWRKGPQGGLHRCMHVLFHHAKHCSCC
jgi:hypothetical protein